MFAESPNGPLNILPTVIHFDSSGQRAFPPKVYFSYGQLLQQKRIFVNMDVVILVAPILNKYAYERYVPNLDASSHTGSMRSSYMLAQFID